MRWRSHRSSSGRGPLQSKRDRTLERETEVELARQLMAGEPEAFDRFVEHFRAKIFHYSWLMCGHREDAEEVAQETLQHLSKFRSSPRTRAGPSMGLSNRQKRLSDEAAEKRFRSLAGALARRLPAGDGP